MEFKSALRTAHCALLSVSLLEVRNLKVHFPVRHALLSRARAFVKAESGKRKAGEGR